MRTTTAARLGVATTAFALALSLGASTAIAEDTGAKTAELGMVKPDDRRRQDQDLDRRSS